ncbi:MAG: putative ral secretion pathway protein GspK, partial [Hyphomicrobiales bacterium]|nr:putative ral secretion pathway protein GspK [Hyphomicrobiales bacterium]
IDLNLAPPILLSSLLAHLAQDQESAESAADFIIQRRPKPQATQTSAAESPFRTISELEQSGLSADLVSVLKPYLTVFSGRAQIDPRLAPDEVLAALPEMSEARLRNLLDLRRANSQDANAWQREAGPAAGLLSLDPGNAARIRIDVTLASGFRKTSEVVATHFQDDREPYRILSWDDAPGTSAPDARSGDNR